MFNYKLINQNYSRYVAIPDSHSESKLGIELSPNL